MTVVRRRLPAFLIAALLVVACGDQQATPSPSAGASLPPTPTPVPTERAFEPAAWPAAGSACGAARYAGLLGRVEATGPRTVRFTLCTPDGAFPARLAHPSLGILDAVVVERVEGDPAAVTDVAGAGTFRIEAWTAGDNVRLARTGEAPAGTPTPDASGGGSSSPAAVPPSTIILRWAASPASRSAALRAAGVDGIDAPSAADLEDISTLPELATLPRSGLATAYLGIGTGHQLGRTAVRRAFAMGLDRELLARTAFAPGAEAASHLAPCPVLGGCVGTPWYEFNGPAGTALLDDAGFDGAQVPLHVPDAPAPGLPDPAGLAAAIRDQLRDSIGVTVKVQPQPAAELDAAVAERRLDGLFLAGIASPLADASGYLGPLFGPGTTTMAAVRGKGVREALAGAAGITDPVDRAAALGEANDELRAIVPLVPLVHPGTQTAWRADVDGAAVSPIGADPLGAFVPGDRSQVVVMGEAEPGGAWCGLTDALDALRLCALVTPGLYGFAGASLRPAAALATGCEPSDDARVWTCRLRAGGTFADGAAVDAADVVATFRALGDARSPLRASEPATSFAAWDGLFGGPVPGAPAP